MFARLVPGPFACVHPAALPHALPAERAFVDRFLGAIGPVLEVFIRLATTPRFGVDVLLRCLFDVAAVAIRPLASIGTWLLSSFLVVLWHIELHRE